jgi:hypothetical protein
MGRPTKKGPVSSTQDPAGQRGGDRKHWMIRPEAVCGASTHGVRCGHREHRCRRWRCGHAGRTRIGGWAVSGMGRGWMVGRGWTSRRAVGRRCCASVCVCVDKVTCGWLEGRADDHGWRPRFGWRIRIER